jgi:hypothetical protein
MASDLRRATPPAPHEAIHEPPSDWVALDRAPGYCCREGFVTSSEAWNLALEAEVKEYVASTRFKSTEPWSFDLRDGDLPISREISFRSAGILTAVWPGGAYVRPVDSDRWSIICSGPSLWRAGPVWGPPRPTDTEWDELLLRCTTEAERNAALRHKYVLVKIADAWRLHFLSALDSGMLRIMARKNSVLSPFEAVTLDQWQYFRLDERSENPSQNWLELERDHIFFNHNLNECTATGPAGERLFSIFVAPDLDAFNSQSLEQKCQLWVRRWLRDYPDRAPKPKEELMNEAAKEFPGLLKKSIESIMLMTLEKMGQRNWIRGGRPSAKPPQKPPPKK